MTTPTTLWQIFWLFFKLGCCSFGGPIAHIGFFRSEFVAKHAWLSERDYFDLVALCQFLPGPASSQVGMAIGLLRGGYAGALLAWLGFTLPSAVLMLGLALSLGEFADKVPPELLHGLKIAAFAVIAQAVYAMAKSYCSTWKTAAIAGISLLFLSFSTAAYWQVVTILCGAVLGISWLPITTYSANQPSNFLTNISKPAGLVWGGIFLVLLVGLPMLSHGQLSPLLNTFDAFFRAGSLVFGGGHAVLPMLQADFVSTGRVSADSFIAGYGAVQAVPGPLFSFAGFLGASLDTNAVAPATENVWFSSLLGGVIGLIAIFAPAFLLIAAVLPYWQDVRTNPWMQKASAGIGSSVVAILLSTLYQPVWTSTILSMNDLVLALLALVALQFGKLSPFVLVLVSACLGLGVHLLN